MDNCLQQLLPFHNNVTIWLKYIDTVFATTPALTDDQKYYATVIPIPTAIASSIAPTLTSLPENKYLAVKEALLNALGLTQEYHLHALESVQYDGSHLSLLLQHLQALNATTGHPYSSEMLGFQWLSLLPLSTWLLLADSSIKTIQNTGVVTWQTPFTSPKASIHCCRITHLMWRPQGLHPSQCHKYWCPFPSQLPSQWQCLPRTRHAGRRVSNYDGRKPLLCAG